MYPYKINWATESLKELHEDNSYGYANDLLEIKKNIYQYVDEYIYEYNNKLKYEMKNVETFTINIFFMFTINCINFTRNRILIKKWINKKSTKNIKHFF